MVRTFTIFIILLFNYPLWMIGSGQQMDEQVDEIPNIASLSYPEWQDSVIHVIGDHNYAPYEFLNEKGKPDGFNIDIIKAVASVMKLSIEIDLNPWREVRKSVDKGDFDVISGMYQTAEREKYVDFTIPHFISSYSFFVRKGTKIRMNEDLNKKVILIQEGDLGHDFMKEKYPQARLITFIDFGDLFVALSEGLGDCAFHSRLQGLRFLKNNKIDNVVDTGKAVIQQKYCLGVPEGRTELLAILNEGLSIIKTNGTYDTIYDEWFGVYESDSISWNSVVKYVLWIILPLVFLVIVFVIWSYTLRKQVYKSTLELQAELQRGQTVQKELERFQRQLEGQNQQLIYRNERIAQMNEELNTAKLLAEKNDNLKTAFLANMSHEIRTPMNSIIGFCELLEIDAVEPSVQKYTGIISNSAQRLMRLLDDIIDISKIESGVIGFSVSQVRVVKIVKELYNQYQLVAENKKVELVLESDPRCEDFLLNTDPNRLMQVLNNFLNNAFKHTDSGSVVLGCSKQNNHLKFWVSDTGRGIPAEDLPHVFERFYQAGNHQAGGTGLGLAIARKIVLYFGGEMGVESKENEGSVFWFTHPLNLKSDRK